LSVESKLELIDSAHEKLSVTWQCELIELCRSSFYRRPMNGETEKNLELMRLIDEEYTRHPFYGARKIRDFLRKKGFDVNRKRVRRLMVMMGLESVAPKPNTSSPRKEHKVYPYLLGGVDVNRSNQVWCSDITYIRMPGGFVYLVAVMDWYSRRVLSWEVSVTMDDSFCVRALESAIRRYGVPSMFNTDQGSQFTGDAFTGVLKAHGIAISMDGKGRAMDNIFIERLWRSVKYEEIYLREYSSVLELIRSLSIYFDFYNFERQHSGLNGSTPDDFYNSGFEAGRVAS